MASTPGSTASSTLRACVDHLGPDAVSGHHRDPRHRHLRPLTTSSVEAKRYAQSRLPVRPFHHVEDASLSFLSAASIVPVIWVPYRRSHTGPAPATVAARAASRAEGAAAMYDLQRHEHPRDPPAPGRDLSLGPAPAAGTPARSTSAATTTAASSSTACAPRLGDVRPAAHAPEHLGPRLVVDALREAVAELRAIDLTYGPGRPDSLVARLRRDEISRRLVPAAGRPGGPLRRDAGGHRRLVRRLGGTRRLRPERAAGRLGRRTRRRPAARGRRPRLRGPRRRRPDRRGPVAARRPVADRRPRPGRRAPPPRCCWS